MADARKDHVTKFITKFIDEFSLSLDDNAARDSITSTCSPDIVWRDHAFHIQRTGHEAVLGLRKSFNHCNQPLETQVKFATETTDRVQAFHHTETGAVVQAVWVGCCKNDIVRPNGQVAVKANGRDFVAHVCFVFEVHPTQGITKIDEYYNKPWWDGVSQDDYHKIEG